MEELKYGSSNPKSKIRNPKFFLLPSLLSRYKLRALFRDVSVPQRGSVWLWAVLVSHATHIATVQPHATALWYWLS